MPPRIITAAILAFWLAMTGLLIHREVVPMMLADVSPTFQPDLTDEIGSPLVGWTVLRDDERIGSATSKVAGLDDGTYEFRSTFHFDKLSMGPANARIHIRQMENTYRVTEDGKLRSVSTKVAAHLGKDRPVFAQPDMVIGIQGEVIDGVFEPKLLLFGAEHPLEKIHFRQEGSVVNPMHLINRLRGLRPGQTWKVNRVDAFQALIEKLTGGQGVKVPALIAEVKADTLKKWDKKDVACNVIEYRELGKEVAARTWVRKSDGLVLQQEASFGFELVLRRVPN